MNEAQNASPPNGAGRPGASRLGTAIPLGTVLADRFEITEKLGVGGAGMVYAARDRLVDEEVALKILHPTFRQSDEQLSRLRGEVRVSRRIAHPNVCRVHGLFEHRDLIFLAMELLRGQTLRRRLRKPLSLPEALELVRQLGAGLAAAHRAGVIHCDVKPENAILVVHGEQVRVIVTDFGVARLLGANRTAELAAWRAEGAAGAPVGVEGTAAYMSPEQLEDRPLDERTDIYSLAAVVFEMLGGSPPYGRSNFASFGEMSSLVRRTIPALPSDRPADVGPETRARLASLLARGLAGSPAARFETVDAFVAALVAAVGSSTGVALPPSTPTSLNDPSLGSDRLTPSGAATVSSRRLATVVHVVIEAARPDDELSIDAALAVRAAAETVFADAGAAIVGRAARMVTAVFGAVTSNGDEAHRAADAARAVVAAAAPELVAVRCGIDTGRLLVRERLAGEVTVAGEALRQAEALASASAAGEVLASPRSSRLLHRRFLTAPAMAGGSVRVLARLRGASPSGAAPLVGRALELRSLTDELAAAARLGAPRSALVLGPPGIGKSRLRAEVAELLDARAGFETVAVTAEPEDALASHAVLRLLLRRLLGVGEQATLEEARAAVRRSLSGAGGEPEATLVGPLAALLSEDTPVATGAPLLSAARACLAAAAARRPLLLVVDDLHWADGATLELVEALARGELQVPLALFALSRSDLLERRPRLAEAFRVRIDLPPLALEESRALVAQLLGGASPEAEPLSVLAEGNPFFVEELVRDLRERGPSGDAPAPTTIEAALQARLDRASPEEREVLRAAAALGTTFRHQLLRATLLELGAVATANGVERALVALETRDLVRALPPDASADDAWTFKHATLRDVTYGELAAGARRAVHAAAARALRAAQGGTAAGGVEYLVGLARHLEGAGEPLEAAAAYRAAGDLATSQSAPADALRCYLRAQALSGSKADTDLLIRLGDAAVSAGAFEEAQRALDAAVALTGAAAEDSAARREAARALHARALLAKQRGRWEAAVADARSGLEILREEDPILAARLHGALGWFLGYILGETQAGLAEGLRAVAALEGGPQLGELARAYANLGASYMRAGRWRDQLRCNRRNLEIGEAEGAIELQARAHMNLGVNHIGLGEPRAAAEHSRRAIALFRKMCAPTFEALAHNNLALALIDEGALDDAESEIREALRLSDLTAGCYFRYETEVSLARIAAKRGDVPAAIGHARAALGLAVADGARIDEGVSRKFLGAMLSRAGDAEGALRELDLAEALLRDADLGEHARVRAERARALARRGDLAAAEAERAAARAAFEALGAALELAKLDDLGWV